MVSEAGSGGLDQSLLQTHNDLPTLVLGLEICLLAHHHLRSSSVRDAHAKLQTFLPQVLQCGGDTVHQAKLPPQDTHQGEHDPPYLCTSNAQPDGYGASQTLHQTRSERVAVKDL